MDVGPNANDLALGVGMSFFFYRTLYDLLLPFRGLRAPSRAQCSVTLASRCWQISEQ
jgi:hypothetical protein